MKVLLFGVCCSALFLLSACGEAPETPPPSDAAPSAVTETASAQSDTLTLEPFSAIEVDVLAADIRVVPGETWSLSYQLSDKEPLEQLGVVGDTLYVETRFDPLQRPELTGDWYVTITVPENASLTEVELETVSGKTEVEALSCDVLSLSSTAGAITAQQISAREVEAGSISGNLSLTAVTADSLEAETTSGKLVIEGAFGQLETDTVSGSTAVTAAVSGSAQLESVSGGIGLTLTTPAALRASSVGGVTLNGEKHRGSLTTTDGVPVEVMSVSGKLVLETP